MNWDAVAAIGEIVGALAVVLTLYYLAIQARSAKDVALAQAQRELAVGLNSVWSRLEQDRELLRLVRIAVNDWQALDNNEKAAVHALFTQLFANFSAAIGPQHLKGNEDFVRTWEDVLLGILLSSGGKAWWDEAHYLYDPTLVTRLNARLQASVDLPPSWNNGLSFWTTEDSDFAKSGTDK